MAKVMLVEDDNNLREIYEARLAAEGYEIISAPDGEAALALAIKEKPDLIISDIMMPKVSGFDMLDILRSTTETKNTKIIMMTALNQAEDKARAEQLGADMYLVKSQVTLEDVVKAAQKILGDQNPSSVAGVPIEQPTPTPAVTTSTSLTNNVPSVPAQPASPAPQPQVSVPPAPVTPAPPVSQPSAVTPQPVQVTAPAPEQPNSSAVANPPTQPDPVTSPSATQTDTSVNQAPVNPTIPSTATTAEEEAALQAQIEQFITQNPTISTSADGSQAPSEQLLTPQPASPAPQPQVSVPPAPVTPTQAPITVQEPPASTETTTLPEDAPAGEQKIAKSADADVNTNEPGIDASVSGRKKVIQPISDVLTNGPNLDALLAKEGATNTQPITPSANSVITPQGVTMPAAVQDVIPPQQQPAPQSTPAQSPQQPAA